jgi:phage gp36-like protein
MAYITVQDLINLFGEPEIVQLSNLDEPNITTVNSARVNQAIAWSEDIFHSYASFYYVVPLVFLSGVIPPVVRGILLDFTRYQLDANLPREDVRIRYEDGIKWLTLLAAGKVSLGDDIKTKADLALEKPLSGPFGVSGYREPIYTKESLSGLY